MSEWKFSIRKADTPGYHSIWHIEKCNNWREGDFEVIEKDSLKQSLTQAVEKYFAEYDHADFRVTEDHLKDFLARELGLV